jgi:beta-glucosidase
MLYTRLLSCLAGILLLTFSATAQKNIDDRVDALLKKMTLEEKIGQLNQIPGDISTGTDVRKDDMLTQIRAGKVGSILSHSNFDNKITMQRVATKETRLGIPLIFGFDVIHGYKTIFPIPLAQAASWDMAAIEQCERIAAIEASADGQNWTFSPMVDLARDPRWGRVMEGSGEDPYLGSRVAEARVKGFQGTDLTAPNTIAACAKHFAGYGFSEAGRDYNTVDLSEQRLREFVLPPFQAAAQSGCATFMNAFNLLNGTPASMNAHLMKDILRNEWAWKGMVVSDWNSVGETIIHGAAEDDTDAAAKCLTAGCDMDMVGGTYMRGMKKALEEGRVTKEQIDEAVRRVLRLKFQLGLFDDPFRYLNPTRRQTDLEKPEYRQAAREMAAKSMVLLKNQGNLLPLAGPTDKIKKVVIIGPYADNRANKNYMSFWTLGIGENYDTTKIVSPAEGLKPMLEGLGYEVKVVRICPTGNCSELEYVQAMKSAKEADLVIACVGERGIDCGESRSVADINLRNNQENLIRTISRNAAIPTVMVVFNSRPLTFEWARENVQAILVAWQPGYETGNALADVLTGKVNPSGKLPVTFPRHQGQIPLYYNHFNTGRPQSAFGTLWTSGYLDQPTTPAWPFGFGLSYTTFEYSSPALDRASMQRNGTVEAMVQVKNTGKVAGEEVVQLYIRDLSADVARPVKELKGFQKIKLNPGESKEVRFTLTAKDLSYWNQKPEFKADAGKFQIMIGGSSESVKTSEFELR